MERLDELCLQLILQYLRLPDQLAMLQCDERCYALLGSLWRRQLMRIELNLLQVPICTEIFEFLILSSCRELRVLRLNYVDKEKFEVLVRHRFPKLQMLQIDALPPFFLCHEKQRQLKEIILHEKHEESGVSPVESWTANTINKTSLK